MSAAGHLHWELEPAVLIPMSLTAIAYTAGTARLWSHAGVGRGISFSRALLFGGALLLSVIALLSPLASLSEELFSAHMVVHELLMTLIAPLFILSRPAAAFAWSMPAILPSLRRLFLPFGFLSSLATPVVATVLQAIAIWGWHVPVFFEAALRSEVLHTLQHVSFLATALLFWKSIHDIAPHRAGLAIACLFATSLHTSFLGALLTVSPRVWFPASGGFGLSALEDQQLGGAIMWVPGGMAYAVAALWIAAHLLQRSSRPTLQVK